MRLLLISNSTNAGEQYLEYPMPEIKKFIGSGKVNILFIPYAGITLSYDQYAGKVNDQFIKIGHTITSIHTLNNPLEAVKKADIFVVGGGNTWQLLNQIQMQNLLNPIREKVISGTPYIGWSAGSNLCCPTIRTTNDMPVVEPESFSSLNLIPFQINPHFTDSHPEGHAGETREERIKEFIFVNPDLYVVGLREGTMLTLVNNSVRLIGKRNARIFRYGLTEKDYSQQDDLDFLLNG
jgi:dipeptidase E